MALHNPSGVRERIDAYGPPGAGKTFAFLTVPRLLVRQGNPDGVRCHILDLDEATERMLCDPAMAQLSEERDSILVVHECLDMDELKAAALKVQKEAQPGDWILCDMLSQAWELAQEEYVNRVFGEDQADYYLELMKAREEGDEGEGPDVNWNVIKKSYNEFFVKTLMRTRCNIFCTAPPKALVTKGSWKDDKALIDTFGRAGDRPDGEKKSAHRFHSVLRFEASGNSEDRVFRYTSIKDRSRPLQDREEYSDFAMDYLIGVAGWEL